MKKLILVCLLAAFNSFGAQLIPPCAESPILIEMPMVGKSGSGFLLLTSNRLFLVTAKHVLFDINSTNIPLPLLSTNLVISGLLKDRISVSQLQYNIGAYYNNNEVRYSTNHDVAVAFIGLAESTGSRLDNRFHRFLTTNMVTPITVPANGLRRFADVAVGEDIYTFGYPGSVGTQLQAPQLDKSRPLARRGIISDKDPVRMRYVVDLPIYFGNSGGPVVAIRDTAVGEFQNHVIAVVSQFIPFEDVWISERYKLGNVTWSNSGHAIAEPIDFVLELLW